MVPPRPRIPYWKGLSAESEEKREPVSDIDTALVDSLKVLDPKRPIREEMVVAQGLGDAGRQAPRDEKGDRGRGGPPWPVLIPRMGVVGPESRWPRSGSRS